MMRSLVVRVFTSVVGIADRLIGWHRLPRPLGLLALLGIRIQMRAQNLHDVPAPTLAAPCIDVQERPRDLTVRTPDGSYNDLDHPSMGKSGTPFGRNVPLDRTHRTDESSLFTPNPRTVSLELLTRDRFVPATTLNLLAAAWLQFTIHDWFSHNPNQKDNPWAVPLSADDPWHEHPMSVERTREHPSRRYGPGTTPVHMNSETHWWDASQIYGSTKAFQMLVRAGTGGKLRSGPDGALPFDPLAVEQLVDVAQDWWIGLALMYTVFMREHNAICDRLHAEYPTWTDDALFERARLINAALLAKIHTVEWTTAILDHPTLQAAMHTNWWGIASERVTKLFGRISDSEVISGIPGSHTDHFGVPYAITEEFVSVYRMHPLIPDDYSLRAAADDALIEACTFPDVAGRRTHEVLQRIAMTDLLYSFGTSHPGAITLHNYPRSLQKYVRPNGTTFDLASVDILRDRERGVPRYNEFRRLIHLTPAKTFEQLTDDPVWREELRRVYENDIESVDLMIGMYAEKPPKGFGFSDTAFRIFVLMASRRLNSDRFYTTDYTPRVYTQVGLDWIANNDMATVLLRHYPALRPAFANVTNAFAPWTKATPF